MNAPAKTRTLYCSFCGKGQDEVKKLIEGPTVFICDECIVLCFDIVYGNENPDGESRQLVLRCRRITDAATATMHIANNLLSKEAERHAPYVALRKSVTVLEEMLAEPAGPVTAVVEEFPAAEAQSGTQDPTDKQ